MSLSVLRLVTVHPSLVHFTIGALPLLLLAYAVAAWRRSERWTFVGDVTLFVTAVLTLLVAAFGLVASFVMAWPADVGTWRWIHLAVGAGVTAALLVFAL